MEGSSHLCNRNEWNLLVFQEVISKVLANCHIRKRHLCESSERECDLSRREIDSASGAVKRNVVTGKGEGQTWSSDPEVAHRRDGCSECGAVEEAESGSSDETEVFETSSGGE